MRRAIEEFFNAIALSELRLMNKGLIVENVSYNTMMYLDVISQEEQCTPSQLARLLNVTKSAITVKIGELVRLGFIEKVRSEVDGRVYYLRLTGKAFELYELYHQMDDTTLDAMRVKFSSEQMELFAQMLREYARIYREN